MAKKKTTKSAASRTKKSTTKKSATKTAKPASKAKTKAKPAAAVTPRKTTRAAKPAASKPAATRPSRARKPTTNGQVELTHDLIAQRAYQIWLSNGCVPGRDDANWQEAVAQLQAER